MTIPGDAGGYARGMAENAAEPQIIQGGMGVAVSGWQLARDVLDYLTAAESFAAA